MTSHSLFGSDQIHLANRRLSENDDERDCQEHAITMALASGAAHALLDAAIDHRPGHRHGRVHAEYWHTPVEGWELEALDESARAQVIELSEHLVREETHQIVLLARNLTKDRPGPRGAGSAFWQIGQLAGQIAMGLRIGFTSFARGDEALAGSHLTLAVLTKRGPRILEPFFDADEDPCLLHLN